MKDQKKHEMIVDALKAVGYHEITLCRPPTLFRCNDGSDQSELEFGRAFFDHTSANTLKHLLHEKILPALKQNPSKKVHVSMDLIAIIALRTSDGVRKGKRKAEKYSSR